MQNECEQHKKHKRGACVCNGDGSGSYTSSTTTRQCVSCLCDFCFCILLHFFFFRYSSSVVAVLQLRIVKYTRYRHRHCNGNYLCMKKKLWWFISHGMNITMCVFQKNWQKWDKVSCMLRPADKQRVSTAAPGSVSKFQFVVFLHISIRALLFVGKWEWIKPCPWKYSSHLQLESVFSPFTNFAKLLHGARVHSDTQCYWLIHEHFTLITFILFWFFIFV